MGAEARFFSISGFTQLSGKRDVVADHDNHCLRLIDRTTNSTSVFSGQCESQGYKNGRPGQFYHPWSVATDKRNEHQLLITDSDNRAVRTVDVHSQAVSTFVKSDSFEKIRGITQEEKSGDLYVTVHHAVLRITYREREICVTDIRILW